MTSGNDDDVKDRDRTVSKPLIFISHSHQDAPAAQALSNYCKAIGAEAWLADESIRPGENWRVAVNEAVARSDIFLVLISSAALESDYLRQEWSSICEQGWKKPNVRIVPIRLESVSLPPFLQDRVSLDALETRALQSCAMQIQDRSADIGKEPASFFSVGSWKKTTERFQDLQEILTQSDDKIGGEPESRK